MSQTEIFEPDGRAVHYVDEGAGPALILVPGRGLDVTYLGTLASVLVEEDFRVVRIGSRRPSADAVTMHDLAQDVVDVMDHVGLADAWVGGHAFGGAVARTVALDHAERVNGVLLLAVEGATPPAPAAEQALATLLGGAADGDALAAVRVLTGESADAALAWNILERSRDAGVEQLQRAALASTPEPEWAALAPSVPALIVHGTDDRVTPLEEAERLQATAPDRASLVRLEGGGHLFPVTHPGEASWVIEDYLDWD